MYIYTRSIHIYSITERAVNIYLRVKICVGTGLVQIYEKPKGMAQHFFAATLLIEKIQIHIFNFILSKFCTKILQFRTPRSCYESKKHSQF